MFNQNGSKNIQWKSRTNQAEHHQVERKRAYFCVVNYEQNVDSIYNKQQFNT